MFFIFIYGLFWSSIYQFKFSASMSRGFSIPTCMANAQLSHDMRFQQCGMFDQQRLRPAFAYAQTDQSLCWSLKYSMTVKLLTEPHLRFLSLTEGCTGSSESALVKMPHCWKTHVAAHFKMMTLHFPVAYSLQDYHIHPYMSHDM